MRGEYNVCPNVGLYGVGPNNGAFADYVKIPYNNVFKIPDEVSFEAASVSEPLACATYSVTKLEVKLGQTVVVFGCGTIGLMDVQLVKAAGAGKVIAIDIVDYNLEKALELGANFVFNTADSKSKYYTDDIVKSVQDVNHGDLAARAIVPTNAIVALQQALLVTAPRAIVVYFGLPSPEDVLKVPVLDFITSDKIIKASWLSPLVWDNVFNVVASGQVKLEPLITHQFSLENTVEGIRFMKETKENRIKGIVRMKD
jgi:L-iditol 2-dehydrogenase